MIRTFLRHALFSAGNVKFVKPGIRIRGEDSPARYTPGNMAIVDHGFGGNVSGTYDRVDPGIAMPQHLKDPAMPGVGVHGGRGQGLINRGQGGGN